MNHDAARLIFTVYLPLWLRERIGSPGLQPGVVHSGEATILFADLSGFTRLTAAFAALPDGAERLHEALNQCYAVLVETIVAFGGDVASIAGDALVAWWPGQTDLEYVRRCGAQMLAAIAAFPNIATPEGLFRLHLRIGVSTGLTHAVLAGLPSHGLHFVLCGPAVIAAAAAERSSAAGTILLMEAAQSEPIMLPAPAGTPTTPLSWEHFLPPSFVERLRVGELIAEYRRCVPIFASFDLPPHPQELHPLVAQVQAVVLRWGGWLNEIEVGDKGAVFVLLFGAPLARGDDPSRAVGCCLELRERRLIGRAGITLGWLFVGAVGDHQRRVYTAQGDDMNLAAHLMERAAPGEILVSGRVRNDVMGRYRTSEPFLMTTKGHAEGVPVARIVPIAPGGKPGSLLSATVAAALPEATVVGRVAERQAMAATAEAAAGGQAAVLIVEGESGIGKSCLLQELLARWTEQGRLSFSSECSSGGVPQPLLAWRSILFAICAIEEGESPQTQTEQLACAVRSLPADLRTEAPLLARVLGLSGDRPDGTVLLDATEEKQLLKLAVALIALHACHSPILIVLEDIHWADDLSLRLAVGLLDAGPRRICLALSHRPLDGPPPPALAELRAHPSCVRVAVSRLDGDETLDLIREQLGVADVHPDLGRHIERHTEGQPLFVKEYLRVLRQRQLISLDENTARLARTAVNVQVSNSAQGIIQARVDQLDEATRLTLKVAAVLGPTFQLRLLTSVHPARPEAAVLQEHLTTLIGLQILKLELEGPEAIYRFTHGITHEVAYASLLFGQRRQLHTDVVRYYERVHGAEIAAGTAPLAVYDPLIYHLGHAQEWRLRADYCQVAARLATAQAATGTALRYTDQALALTHEPERRFELLLLRMALNERAGSFVGQAEDQPELDRLAKALCDPLSSACADYFRLRRALIMGATEIVLVEAPTVIRRIRRHIAGSPESKRLAMLTDACTEVYARARAVRGDLAGARRLLRPTLERCQRGSQQVEAALLNPPIVASRCLDSLGAIALATGNPIEALACFEQALMLARRSGDSSAECRARSRRGRARLALGEIDSALGDARLAWTTSSAVSDRLGQALALRLLAAVSAARGLYDEAERDAQFALTICARAGARTLEMRIWRDIAVYFAAQGLAEAAESAWVESERALRPWAGEPQPGSVAA